MATIYTIWSRKERKNVPTPDATYPTSQAAQEALRRMVKTTGDTKDHQNQTFDIESHTV